ncbi:MAG TPA: hypothetical protein VGW10_05390 [Solirubrobacteraceae bacterium]|nr:hypothetical protein [Solirubrobacteraceae bacterium]
MRACSELGEEADVGAAARISGVKPNATALALQGLVRRKLVRSRRSGSAVSP